MYSFALTSTTEYTERQSNKWLEKQLAAIAQENKQALAVLYENTKAAVYGFALSILKNPYDAEDVLQDVYVCIYQSASRYHAQGKPMAWIFTITKNLSYLKLPGIPKKRQIYRMMHGSSSVHRNQHIHLKTNFYCKMHCSI